MSKHVKVIFSKYDNLPFHNSHFQAFCFLNCREKACSLFHRAISFSYLQSEKKKEIIMGTSGCTYLQFRIVLISAYVGQYCSLIKGYSHLSESYPSENFKAPIFPTVFGWFAIPPWQAPISPNFFTEAPISPNLLLRLLTLPILQKATFTRLH